MPNSSSRALEGGTVQINAGYPAGVVGDTMTNLREAAAGEREEWSDLYANFSQTAEEEALQGHRQHV